jgi:hypothetical protein
VDDAPFVELPAILERDLRLHKKSSKCISFVAEISIAAYVTGRVEMHPHPWLVSSQQRSDREEAYPAARLGESG